MNFWLSTNLVGATTTTTTLIMTIFFTLRHHSSRCNGFRIASIGAKNPNSVWCRRMATGALQGKSFLVEPPRAPSSMGRQSIYTATRMALFSTAGEETTATTESKTGNDDNDIDDVSRSILYQQFKDLSLEIRKHDDIYYGGGGGGEGEEEQSKNGSTGFLSDDEFDALVRKEEELEQRFPEFLATWQQESGLGISATRSGRVGAKTVAAAAAAASGGTNANAERLKRRHSKPMLSLDNVHNNDQLWTWLKKVVRAVDTQAAAAVAAAAAEEESGPSSPSSSRVVTIVTEPKLDGVSLSLRYESTGAGSGSTDSGNLLALRLKWASTRGDGTIGQDVTAAAKEMVGVPETIYLSSMQSENQKQQQEIALEVRGEVVLPRSEFRKIQEQAKAAAAQQQQQQNVSEDHTTGDSDSENAARVSKTPDMVVSFSNPRNAASGIMLRKESGDPEEQASSRNLRSLLRFYAYDLSGLEEQEQQQSSGEKPELDGIRIREQLSEWGFSLALPVAVTNLEWEASETETESETESATEAKTLWDDWFRKSIAASDQIQPILEYFTALEDHREDLLKEDNKNLTMSTTRKKKNASNHSTYEWGDFDMDGCVHKVAQASIRSAMGYTTKSPKWATAHKFPAQSSVARLLDIIVQVGRTGAITPVAILEPTEVGGVTVQRATLHNFGHLQEIMGFENNEDSEAGAARIPKYEPLLVQRAGDVIPQVVRRIKNHSEQRLEEDSSTVEWISLDPPDKCPYCSSPVTYDTLAQSSSSSSSSSSSVGQVVRCSGPPLLCPPRAVTSLKHAFSRDAMDLTGLSEARIQQLMDANLLQFPSDIFTMEDGDWGRVEALPGWGKKSCQNLRDSSQRVASKGISLGRFIYSLGIRHVGKHTSELVASCYGSVGKFMDALDSASKEYDETIEPDESLQRDVDEAVDGDVLQTIASLPHRRFPELESKLGIGPVAIDSLVAFSKTQELVDASKLLAESLNILEQKIVLTDDDDDDEKETDGASKVPLDDDASESGMNREPWKGLRVVFTGSLGMVDGLTRSRAQEIAKQLGARATPGSVSKSTNLVVFGDKGGKKLTQARELGIDTMEAHEFVELANKLGLLESNDDG